MGNVRILFALHAALLTLSNVGCSGPISGPQALVMASRFAEAGQAPWEPGLLPLPAQNPGAHEVLATDEIPLIQQTSCAANEPSSIETPITAPPLLNNELGIPHDSNGEVINPFRGGRLDGFATADKQPQDAPADQPPTEKIASAPSAEAILPATNTQAQSNDAITPGPSLEPAPLDLPPSGTPVASVAQAKSPPDDDPPQVIIESTSSAKDTTPLPSAAQGPSSIVPKGVMEDVAPEELAKPELPLAEILPAESPELSVAPIAATSPATIESKTSCDIPEPPALIAAMNFLDVPASNSTSEIRREDAPATATAALPPAPPESKQLASLTESLEVTGAKEVRAAFQAEPAIAAAPAPSPLPSQAAIAVSQMNSLVSPPALASAPSTFQIAISPDSPVATIPMSATISGPNGQAQALLAIRVESAPQPRVETPITPPAAPQRSSIVSELPEEPRPVQQPVAVQPIPIGSSFSTDKLNVWRRAKPSTESREVEVPLISNRVSQHLSHSLAP